VRRVLYALAVLALAIGALGLALLPRITTHWFWFGLLGACFSGVGAGGWLLAGATAGPWPRPRTGWFLVPAGLVGAAVNAAGGDPLSLLWAVGEAITGVLLLVPLFPSQRQPPAQRGPGPVQAPPVAGRHENR